MKQYILLLLIRHMGINLCCADRTVPKHSLDIANIDILFQEQSGKGMTEHMWGYMLGNIS